MVNVPPTGALTFSPALDVGVDNKIFSEKILLYSPAERH